MDRSDQFQGDEEISQQSQQYFDFQLMPKALEIEENSEEYSSVPEEIQYIKSVRKQANAMKNVFVDQNVKVPDPILQQKPITVVEQSKEIIKQTLTGIPFLVDFFKNFKLNHEQSAPTKWVQKSLMEFLSAKSELEQLQGSENEQSAITALELFQNKKNFTDNFMNSDPTQSAILPNLEILVELNYEQIDQVLSWVAQSCQNVVKQEQNLDYHQFLWVYSLFIKLDTPVHEDVVVTLTQLLEYIIKNLQTYPKHTPDVEQYNAMSFLIIYIITDYYKITFT